MDPAIQQQPLVESPQATQLPRRAPRVNRVGAQVLQKARHILLRRRHQHTLPALQELGKRLQVAVIGLAGQWTQPFFHGKIRLVVLQKPEVVFNAHTFDYPRENR